MVGYTCCNCNKIFEKKSNYEKHINRKNKCVPGHKDDDCSTYVCNHCGISYTRLTNLRRHIEKSHADVALVLLEKLSNTLQEHEVMIAKLKEDNDRLRHQITLNNNNNCNVNNANTINNTYNIINFGRETHDCLLENEGMSVARSGYMSIQNCVQKMHLNDRLPQCKNIKISNLRSNTAMVYDDGWKAEDVNDALDQLIDARSSDIEALIEKYESRLDPRMIAKSRDQVRKIQERDAEYVKRVKRDIRLLLYNNYK
jgi:hypothetical protein